MYIPPDTPWKADYRSADPCNIADTCSARRSILCKVRTSARKFRSPVEDDRDREAGRSISTRLPSRVDTRSRSSDWRRRYRVYCWRASTCRPRSGYSRPAGCRGMPWRAAISETIIIFRKKDRNSNLPTILSASFRYQVSRYLLSSNSISLIIPIRLINLTSLI